MPTKYVPKRNDARFSLKSSEVFEYNPVSSVRVVNIGTRERPVYKCRSDVSLLLDYKDLSTQVGLQGVQEWIKSMQPSSPSVKPSEKIPDDLLIRFCKSRYVQSPCELQEWQSYLNANAESLVAEFNRRFDTALDSKKAAVAQAQERARISKLNDVDDGGK